MISEKERWKESVRYLQKTIVDRIKQSELFAFSVVLATF